MDTSSLPGRMMALQLKDKTLIYNSYMPFLRSAACSFLKIRSNSAMKCCWTR